jgi:hypothetical protein
LPPGDLAKSSITDQISFLIPTSMSLRDMDPGGCPHHHSLSVAETWSFSIGITCCYEIQRSVCTTSNRHQISICRCKHFLKESVFVSRHMWISVCTSKKRFLWGPHDLLPNRHTQGSRTLLHPPFPLPLGNHEGCSYKKIFYLR